MASKDLPAQFREVTAGGVALAEYLERGQSQLPLANHFRTLHQTLESAPFAMVLLGLSQSARTRVLAWLTGHEFNQLSVTVAQHYGLVEIQLRERGFSFEKSGGSRLEFDRLEPFLEAMQAADLLRADDADSWVDPVRLGMQAARGVQSLNLLLPESAAALSNNPAIITRLTQSANLLAIAAEQDHEPTTADVAATNDLIHRMIAVLPIVITNGDDVLPESIPWLRSFARPQVMLPAWRLSATGDSPSPPLLALRDDPMRASLFLHHHGVLCQQAVETVVDRFEKEKRAQATRADSERRRLAALDTDIGGGFDPRKFLDRLRERVTSTAEQIQSAGRERMRGLWLPEKGLRQAMTQHLEQMNAADLVQTPQQKDIELTLEPRVANALNTQLQTALRQQLTELLQVANGEGEKLAHEVEHRIEQELGRPVVFSPPYLDFHQAWREVGESIRLEIRYRGELPKRGLLNRLGEGRRLVFMVLMSISLIGSLAGFNWRGLWFLGPIFLFIFIGSVVYTFSAWKKEDAARIGKELVRIREAVLADVARVIDEFRRESLRQMGVQFDKATRELLRVADESAQAAQVTRREEAVRLRGEARGKLSRIEVRVRELDAQKGALERLVRQGEELARTCVQLVENNQKRYGQGVNS